MQIRGQIPGGSIAKIDKLTNIYLCAKFDAFTINPTIFTPICWTRMEDQLQRCLMIQEIATHSHPIICCYFEEDQQCHPEHFQERIPTAAADGAKHSMSAICFGDDGSENIYFVTATPKVAQATEKYRCE